MQQYLLVREAPICRVSSGRQATFNKRADGQLCSTSVGPWCVRARLGFEVDLRLVIALITFIGD